MDENLRLVSGEDLAEIDRAQREIAIRFEKSNEMLESCNVIMENHIAHLGVQITEHVKAIFEFAVFKNLNVLKIIFLRKKKL